MSGRSRSGIREWVWQRISALVVGAFFVYLAFFWLTSEPLDQGAWQGLFGQLWFKWSTLAVVVMFALHAWIGLWIVGTDYIKPLWIRYAYQSVVACIALASVLWSIQILWGVIS